jgi:hypothetical protein
MKKFTPILPVFLLAFLISPAFGATVSPFGDIGAGKPYTIIQLGNNGGDSTSTKKKSEKIWKENRKGKKVEIRASEPFMTSDVPIIANPIPAAAWLFGSALLGLIGVSRRQKRKA